MVSSSKPVRKKRQVKIGTGETEIFEGVEKLTLGFMETIHGWIEWIYMELKPFAFADSEYTRKYTKLEKISRHTLEKYLHLLSVNVEQEISNVLPEKIALMVDGWTCGSEHYFGVIAAYPSFQSDFNVVLLAFSTLFDETSQGSRSNVTSLIILWNNMANRSSSSDSY